jgi:septum site-determining protein MinC
MASTAPFTIRGAQFKMVSLQLKDGSPEVVIPALTKLLEQSPAFLRGSPVILGLDELPKGAAVDFPGLVAGLRELKLIPVGAAGGPASVRQAAATAGLAQFTKGQQLFQQDDAAGEEIDITAVTAASPAAEAAAKPPPEPEPVPPADLEPEPARSVESETAAPEPKAESAPATGLSALLVNSPVRAGNRIYAQGRDLICTATVNAGAEVIADGNVHIYGTLRGRAIAGAQGDESARIFVSNFNPELVAVSGLYRVREDLDPKMIGAKVQVSLIGEEMKLDLLD